MANPTYKIVAALRANWPDWQIWYVPKAVGGMIRCAQRWDNEKHVLNAGNADDLTELLEAEAK